MKRSIHHSTMHTLIHKMASDLLRARTKWRIDGPALSDFIFYSLVNPAYAMQIIANTITESDNWSVIFNGAIIMTFI